MTVLILMTLSSICLCEKPLSQLMVNGHQADSNVTNIPLVIDHFTSVFDQHSNLLYTDEQYMPYYNSQ